MGRGPRYSAKASWQKPHGERFYKKGGSSSLPSAPSGAGSGGARLWVKGPVPCRFLGQRPKLTEDAFKLFLYKMSTGKSVLMICLFEAFSKIPDISIDRKIPYRYSKR